MRTQSTEFLTLRGIATAIAAVAFAATIGGAAQAALWTGAGVDDEYSTAANWDDNLVPDGGANSTQDINGAFTVERTIDSTSGRTFIKGGAVVNINGGTHNDQRSGANIFNFVGDNGSGTVNQTAGSNSIGHGLRLGVGNIANVLDGTYNLTGGDLIIYRGSNSKSEGGNGPRPSMEVGDTVGQGTFEISGGSLLTRGPVHIGQTGIFSVVGSNPVDIGPQGSGDGGWIQSGTLKAAIDGAGFNDIFVDDFDDAGGILGIFRAGSSLDLSFDGIAPVAGTWTLMTVENTDILDEGLALSGSTGPGWSFNIDNSGVDGLLTATYSDIPEPTSMALLVIGGLFFLRRRVA